MDMYDILKKLNSVGSTPLYESSVPRASEVDKSKIPAYKRKAGGEEKLTLKDLEAERSKSATGAAGLKKLKDRTDISESEVEEGNEYVNARRDAIRAGKPTFTVGGKTHKVTGDTSQEKAEVDESAEETPRGRIHRAAPGGYGRKYDQDDEEGDEKKAAASKKKAAAPPKINRGPGRPTSGRRPFSGDEAGKLQSYVVGNKPKDFDKGSGVEHGFSTAEKVARKAKAAADKAAYKATGVKPKRLDKDDVDEGESNREMSPQQLNQMWDRLGKGVARHKDDPAVQTALKELEDSLNYLMTQGVAEGEDEFDPANRGEYDREGEMAQDQLTTAADAASELRSILDSDENLPEWVQSKITKAVDYLDTARDYMKSKDDHDEPVKEAGNYSAKRARAGSDIGKPGKKPDFLDMDKDGNKKEPMKKAVADKKAGPKKEVEETTTAGSVATAPAEGGKKTKGGVQFGKGVYEGALAESFSSKLKTMLNEEISMNLTTNSNGTKSLTVTATDDDAMRLAEILKLAGMESQAPAGDTAEACGACGQSPCGCDHIDEDDHANSPDPMYADTDTMVMKLAGGLNGPKAQVNPNNLADNPLAMKRLGVKQSPQVNLGSADIGESIEKRLWTIYNRQDTQ